MSVYKSLLKGIERQTYPGERSKRKEKYNKPEKQVEKDCLLWAEKNNVFLHVVEAKAVFSATAGHYLSGQVEPGFPDLCGNNSEGHSMWVELKAKDRRSQLSVGQYEFLIKKIDQNCFSVVVDSADRLNEYYYAWKNSKNRQQYLKSLLPVPIEIRKRDSRPNPENLDF